MNPLVVPATGGRHRQRLVVESYHIGFRSGKDENNRIAASGRRV